MPFYPRPGRVTEFCVDKRDLQTWLARRDQLISQGNYDAAAKEDQEARDKWDFCNKELDQLDATAGAGNRAMKRQQEDTAARERVQAEYRAVEEAKLKVQKAQEDLDHERAGESEWAVPVLSARICDATNDRLNALEEIRKEKKYSDLGGVISLKAIHDSQDEVREADEKIAAARRELGEFKSRPLPCNHRDVVAIISCRLLIQGQPADPANPCHGERVQQLLRLF